MNIRNAQSFVFLLIDLLLPELFQLALVTVKLKLPEIEPVSVELTANDKGRDYEDDHPSYVLSVSGLDRWICAAKHAIHCQDQYNLSDELLSITTN